MQHEMRPVSLFEGYGFVTNLPRAAVAPPPPPPRQLAWLAILCFFASGFVAGSIFMRVALALTGHRGVL